MGMPVFRIWRRFSPVLATALLAVALFSAPVGAQTPAGNSQAGTGSNPTAQSVNEQQLLQELQKIEGRVSIPNTAANLLQQPQGREYRAFHEGALPWIAAVVIIGSLAALALFYFSKGRIRMEHSPESGVKIKRFNVF